MVNAAQRDPRSFVTPEAFHVAPELLGLRLASPRRRLAAMLIDLVVIGILALVTRSFALLLGAVVGLALLRVSFKRTPVRNSAFDRAMRASVGCLGLFVAALSVTIWLAITYADSDDEDDRGERSGFELAAGDAEPDGRSGPPEQRRSIPETVEPRDVAAVADEVSLYSTPEALEAYAEALRSGGAGDMDLVRRSALEARVLTDVAADTLRALESRLLSLEDEVEELEEDLQETEDELEAAEESGFFAWMREALDELGFGFGWASLYLTVMLSGWKGQTIGKKLLGVRVLRLDGGPITWWVAFERAGGYAAGFATGLLGFAQVFWDANRQGIHDRIVGTVVVRDGAERVHAMESTP